MARERFLVFGAPDLRDDEIEEVVACLRSGWIGTGPRAARLERDFAAYVGWGFPVGVNSCTAALHLSALAAGLGPGDEVITTPLTFCATVNALLHAGATPVLADVDPATGNLDPETVEAAITPRTRAVLPVHYAGRPCDMDRLVALCERHGLILIEDCAHAIEAQWRGRATGTFGQFGCYSFYVTKNVTTGEGGMILARTEEQAARLKVLALHGMSRDAWKRFSDEGYRHYAVTEAGFKYNLMDLAASLGLHQLARVEASWQARDAQWARYQEAFDPLPVGRPAPDEPHTRHARHLYTLLVAQERCGVSRDAFLGRMHARNIGTGVHYLSIPEHPYYQERFGWRPERWPEAMRIGRTTVSLPLGPGLTARDQEDVIEAAIGSLG